ncbi:hypothetical protein LCGC14_2177510 [marine sediment metagenome]|uniref:Uncharacterized protein n=1 Tax=marine sediment metagenome TaxID=412755 RepID=A0A0F9EAH0_9ZZZZ
MDDFELTQRLERIEKALARLLEMAEPQPIDHMDAWTKEYPPPPPWDPDRSRITVGDPPLTFFGTPGTNPPPPHWRGG